MQSKGPIIRTLEVLNALTGLAAIAALVFSLAAFGSRLEGIQQGRQESAYDFCVVFQRVVTESVRFQPAKRQAVARKQSRRFLRDVDLSDCHVFALEAREGRLPKLRPAVNAPPADVAPQRR